MKYAVICSMGFKHLKSYKPILEKYDLETTVVEDFIDSSEKGELCYITINSLEELEALKDATGGRLILRNSYFDEFCGEHNEKAIEIYDGYRE